jgi:hypothetical protein
LDESNRLDRESKTLNKTIISGFRKEYDDAAKIEDEDKRNKTIATIEALDAKFTAIR